LEEPIEIYGKWVNLEKNRKDSKFIQLLISRDKEMTYDFIKFLNSIFSNKDIGLEIRILENYRGIKNSFKDRNQSRLI